MDRRMLARVILAEAAALGLTIEDLVAESSGSPNGPSIAPTVAEYVETVRASFSKGTADTYKSYWRLAVTRFGERPIDAIGVDDCESVVTDAVERARRNRPGTNGRSPSENCIGSLRALFARAERAGLVAKSPAADLQKPRRLPNRRRALKDDELREVIDAVRTTSRDPDLDLLLIGFHLESRARREGALNLRLRDLDRRRSTVWLREKFGIEREQPISPSLYGALENHTSTRGAVAAENSVLRGRSGRPITRRRYNTVFDRARPCVPWPIARRDPPTSCVTRPSLPWNVMPASRWRRRSPGTVLLG
jgi:integrase